MSGGQHEAKALEESVKQVRMVASKLAEALKEAGLRVSDYDLQDAVNASLYESGWVIQRPREWDRE
jgi:hypothetical protein